MLTFCVLISLDLFDVEGFSLSDINGVAFLSDAQPQTILLDNGCVGEWESDQVQCKLDISFRNKVAIQRARVCNLSVMHMCVGMLVEICGTAVLSYHWCSL